MTSGLTGQFGPVIDELISFDVRHEFFSRAVRFINYELIEGDIVEFGVYTGRSLALLAHAHRLNLRTIHKVPFHRRIVGFDSFLGLDRNEHPRWHEGIFAKNHSWHPIARIGDKVDARLVEALFQACDLEPPHVETGLFSETLPRTVPQRYPKIALAHIDCDLYSSTLDVLTGIAPGIQDGTVLLFDDWYNFAASPHRGEQKAFGEFRERLGPSWVAVDYGNYATFGKAFVMSCRKPEEQELTT